MYKICKSYSHKANRLLENKILLFLYRIMDRNFIRIIAAIWVQLKITNKCISANNYNFTIQSPKYQRSNIFAYLNNSPKNWTSSNNLSSKHHKTCNTSNNSIRQSKVMSFLWKKIICLIRLLIIILFVHFGWFRI